MKKLKKCYYEKVRDSELGHYFDLYDSNKEYVATVLLWDSVLSYNKYGVIDE